MKALEQSLAHERARKEAERTLQADATEQEAIKTSQWKVTEEKAKIEALEAEKAQLQQQREREGAYAQEGADKRVAKATAVAI